jgi:hypothetical protein
MAITVATKDAKTSGCFSMQLVGTRKGVYQHEQEKLSEGLHAHIDVHHNLLANAAMPSRATPADWCPPTAYPCQVEHVCRWRGGWGRTWKEMVRM